MAFALACLGFHCSGVLLNPQDMAPNHGGQLYGRFFFGLCLAKKYVGITQYLNIHAFLFFNQFMICLRLV